MSELIKNDYGTFVVLEDKIFRIESGAIFDTGPILMEELKEIELTKDCVEFKKKGLTNRDNDLPAIIYVDGTKYWYQNDRIHRGNDLPAIVYANGSKHWFQYGRLHRDNNQPAVVNVSGIKYWYQNGKLIR